MSNLRCTKSACRTIAAVFLFFVLPCLCFGFLGGGTEKIDSVSAVKECIKDFSSAWPAVSKAEAVIEESSGRILWEHNSNLPFPMASTTKILTAIILIEDRNLDEEVEIPREAVGVEGSSVYLKEGERLLVRDLLYGLLLRSGNDCAAALAIYHSGSIEHFAENMNIRARAFGASCSQFQNPHGLPAEGHFTTANDLARIAAHAMRNPTFREIVSCQSYTVSRGAEKRVWTNKNKLLAQYQGANGIKTGYTKEAGRCLVSAAHRNGMQLICVVLNSPDMYERSAFLLDDCFTKYSMCKIFSADNFACSVQTEVKGKTCRAHCETNVFYPLTQEEFAEIRVETILPECLFLPVRAGECIGKINIYLINQLLFSQKIVSIDNIDKSILDILRDIAKRN